VQFHPSQRGKVSYISNWVGGDAPNMRHLRRLPIRLRVTYSGRTGRRVNFTRDLNETGIFVRSRELLQLHTPIRLVLAPPSPRKTPIRLEGKVSRLVEEGEDRGMGISLTFGTSVERRSFADFIEKLEREFLAGELPEDAIG
jgi:hypothetical protein